MSELYLQVPSLTYAYRAADLLKANRISCRILPAMNRKGCGYRLAVSASAHNPAEILRRAGIPVTVPQ